MSDIQIFIEDRDGEGRWESVSEDMLDLTNHDADVRADLLSDLTDVLWDTESNAIDHTENAEGEWETITFKYEDWARAIELIKEKMSE